MARELSTMRLSACPATRDAASTAPSWKGASRCSYSPAATRTRPASGIRIASNRSAAFRMPAPSHQIAGLIAIQVENASGRLKRRVQDKKAAEGVTEDRLARGIHRDTVRDLRLQLVFDEGEEFVGATVRTSGPPG